MSIKTHDTKVAKDFVDFFLAKGLTPQGVAGLMGNIDKESVFRCNNAQGMSEEKDIQYVIDVDSGKRNFLDRVGFGLVQWTSNGRKSLLLQIARMSGLSIADERVQFECIWFELNNAYKSVLKVLTDANKTVDDCARKVMISYEAPKNQTESNQKKRSANAQAFFDMYLSQTNINPYAEPTRTLYKTIPTMKGDDVKWLQWNLNRKGYTCDIDGSFGKATDKLVRQYQSDNNLEADGRVGGATRRSLKQ